MLTLTDTAAEAVRQISTGSGLEPDPGVRISPAAPTPEGTPLQIELAPEPHAGDQTVDREGAHVYIESHVAQVLDDKILDADLEGDQVRFAIREA
jgi:iron-sulfur cluster assembly protein